MSINRVILSGNITNNFEVAQTKSGNTVVNFTLAVNDRAKNPKTGEWEDKPNFIACECFGKKAFGLLETGRFGATDKVCIEGKLRWNQWERDGETRTKLSVVVEEIELMSE